VETVELRSRVLETWDPSKWGASSSGRCKLCPSETSVDLSHENSGAYSFWYKLVGKVLENRKKAQSRFAYANISSSNKGSQSTEVQAHEDGWDLLLISFPVSIG